MNRVDRRAELCDMARSSPLLRGLDDDAIHELAGLGLCHDYPKNNILFYQNDPPGPVYMVISGRVNVGLNNEEGREVVLSLVEPGGVIGLIAVLDGGSQPANAITAAESRLAKFDGESFARWLDRHAISQRALLSELGQQVRLAYQKIGEHALMGVKERLLFALLEIAEREGQRDPLGEDIIFTRPTHRELAHRIGSSREVVSRLLKEIMESELLQAEGRVIRVPESALVLRED